VEEVSEYQNMANAGEDGGLAQKKLGVATGWSRTCLQSLRFLRLGLGKGSLWTVEVTGGYRFSSAR